MLKGTYRKLGFMIMVAITIVIFTFDGVEVSANAHSSIQLRDGNASWNDGGYRPSGKTSGAKTHARDVDPAVKRAWERNAITRGGKYPRAIYSPANGRRLGYDVYQGNTDHDFKQSWRIYRTAGEDFFTFDGWAVNNGYYHHDRHNTATYIGVVNKNNKSDRRIYKARLTNHNAGKDLEYRKTSNTGAINNKCSNSGKGAFKQYSSECNMEYKWVGFRAYIPLEDLFVTGNEEWVFYIVKSVRGRDVGGSNNGNHLVYDELILPFVQEGVNWNSGELTLRSGEDFNTMRMVTSSVIRQTTPRGLETGAQRGYFKEQREYRWVNQSERQGVTVWHGVRSYDGNDRGGTRYGNSMYWQFGGSIATLKWKRTHADVTIQHVDYDTNTVITTDKPVKKEIDVTHEFKPKTSKALNKQDNKGFNYVAFPTIAEQTEKIKITSDKTIKFTYRSSVKATVRHVDADTGKDLIDPEVTTDQFNDVFTALPKKDNTIKNSDGVGYVAKPSRSSQAFSKRLREDTEIVFKYQAPVSVTVRHVDAKTKEDIIDPEKVYVPYNSTYSAKPVEDGKFKDYQSRDYIAVPSISEQAFSKQITKDTEVVFTYKAKVSDPSRVVEMGSGKTTHGKVEGKAYWELQKDNNGNTIAVATANFTPTGEHYAFRNVKHTVKFGGNTVTQEDPIALSADPETVKGEDFEYNVEYEYTNHFEMSYSCTDGEADGNCFAWKYNGATAKWDEPYVKKFSLVDQEGTFTHQATSRLGRINTADALIFNSPTSTSGSKAGEGRIKHTYFIKEKAVRGNEAYYLIANSPSNINNVIGWVNELDMTTYTHYAMDSKRKELTMDGRGNGYSRAWGGSNQLTNAAQNLKDKTLIVNKTETVGNNNWYRGRVENQGLNMWIHGNYTDSTESPTVRELSEPVLVQGETNATLKLKMDHSYGETLTGSELGDIVDEEFLVGRSEEFTERERELKEFYESFEQTTNEFKPVIELKTQSAFKIKPDTITYKVSVPSDAHTDSNFNAFNKGLVNGWYYPVDVDDNLKDIYPNDTPYEELGDYAYPIQQLPTIDKGKQGEEKVYDLDFVTDYFFITEDTGLIVNYPYTETIRNHVENGTSIPSDANIFNSVMNHVKDVYEEVTEEEYHEKLWNEDLLSSEHTNEDIREAWDKVQRYYLPVSPESTLEPGEEYVNQVFLEGLGLNNVNWHYGQTFSYDNYLFGSGYDDAYLIEQPDSRIEIINEEEGIDDSAYVNKIVITPEQLNEVVEILKERPKNRIHNFRRVDTNIVDKIKQVYPELFDE